jgi:hypothetical protein
MSEKNGQVLSEQTMDSSAFLNVMCLFKVCTQLRTAFFIFRSGSTVTGLARVNCICYAWPHNRVRDTVQQLQPMDSLRDSGGSLQN